MKALKTIGKIILYFLIIILIIILIGAGIIWGYQKYKYHQLAKELEALPMDESLSYENAFHSDRDEKLGDNEMTVEEKLDRGLDPYKTDTSGNRLSDDEAVERGLDPTKFSTADDGISDYVKIEEGLDPKEKVDPKDIDDFTIEDEDLDVTLKTNDLNAKYLSSIESYEQEELDSIYEPVRDPLRIKNFEGEVLIDMPDGKDEDVSAYYYNFEKNKMEKIKKQKWTDGNMMLSIHKDYPLYFFNEEKMEEYGDYYYFRISPYIFGPGYDHKVFIFKQGFFTDKLFENGKIEDDEYGVVEISKAKVSFAYAKFLDALFSVLDSIFQPLDDVDSNIYSRIWLDYGKIEGTSESVQYYVMPWLHEDNSEDDEEIELETENEDSKKVIDSGFRPEHHAFLFGNMRTEVADGGVCAGISRTTERVFNDQDIKSKKTHESDRDEFDGLHYDISGNEDEYPFLEDGELFDYTFTDDQISHLTEDEYMEDKVFHADKLSEPDQSLIQLLETQWGVSNDKISNNKPVNIHAAPILDQVEDYLDDGQIVFAAFLGNDAGHSVSIYKMEYDRYDDNLIRLYVYDPNLPYEKLTKEHDKEEVYIEINKIENELIPNQVFFSFTYHPFEDLNSDYGYSDDNGDSMLLYHNDNPIDK